MNKKFNDRKDNYSSKNKKGGYKRDREQDKKRVIQEIRSISTTTSKDGEERKKIQIIPKIKIFNDNRNQQQSKNLEKNNFEKSKKIITIDTIKNANNNKNNYKFKSKISRHIVPYKPASLTNESCHICNKNINNMSNSVIDATSEKVCHFECAVADIKKKIPVRQNQRLVYLGSKTFGIIEDIKEDGRNKFVIIQKFQYESNKT